MRQDTSVLCPGYVCCAGMMVLLIPLGLAPGVAGAPWWRLGPYIWAWLRLFSKFDLG